MDRVICVLTTVHEPLDHRIFFKEAKSLAAAGYRVVLIAPHDRAETVAGIQIVPLRIPRNRWERMLITSARMLQLALHERADAYHFHDPELIPVALVLKLIGRRVIYDVHEDVPRDIMLKHYIPSVLRRAIAWVARLIEQGAARAFDAIVVTTEDIQRHFAWHRRVRLVRNLPVLSWYGVAPTPHNGRGPFTLVYAGGLAPVRGITEIVQAMSLLPPRSDVRLILCGRWSPAEYEYTIRTLPGFTRTQYIGNLAVDDVPAALAEAHAGIICLQPTDTYLTALPTKLFEYMAAGLPVIASSFPLWKSIVEESGAGVCVDPKDPAAIARAILKLHEEPALRLQMGANGRRAVEARWNWQIEERVLAAMYRDILGMS